MEKITFRTERISRESIFNVPDIFDCHIHCSDSKNDILIDYARSNGLDYNFSELLEMMEEHDVTSGLLLSPPLKTGTHLPNDEILDMCRKSKDRLYPVVTLGTSRKQIDSCLKIAKENKGYVKGFKVLLGYYPTYPDARVYSRVYDYAEDVDIPVMFHTGDTATSTGSLEHARPIALDKVANERQSLKIIVCHFGNPWFQETAELLYKHPNVYADISGLFSVGARYSELYIQYLSRSLSEAIYYIGRSDKILFGTDYPIERYTDAIRLVESLKIEKDDILNILSRNGRRVFRI